MSEPDERSDASARPASSGGSRDVPLQFFADDRGGDDSVFRSVDQTDLLARLGDGAIEDDYADPFFDHSLLSTQVPTRSVDLGIRTVVQGGAVQGGAVQGGASVAREPGGDGLGSTVAPVLARDLVARRRFILEGPASLEPAAD